MHCKYLISTADALQKVFIPFPVSHCSLHTPIFLSTLRASSHDHRRSISYRAFKPSTDYQPTFRTTTPSRFGPPVRQRGPVRDENIQADEVHIVREDGSLENPQSLMSVLSSINRKEQFLIQVALHEQTGLPICKAQDKMKVREAERAKDKAARMGGVKKAKQLEMGWGIGPNDLGHRMNNMKRFVLEGKRVEITVGQKKGTRIRGPEETAALLKSIRERIDRDGAREWKEMEGAIGDMVTIFVEPKPGLSASKVSNDS